jgi:hypothetical protein
MVVDVGVTFFVLVRLVIPLPGDLQRLAPFTRLVFHVVPLVGVLPGCFLEVTATPGTLRVLNRQECLDPTAVLFGPFRFDRGDR